MPTSTADATWEGALRDGTGRMRTESGSVDAAFGFGTRFGDEAGTDPEELLAAAHAGCFSMALANALDEEGYTPESVETSATVHLEDGVVIRIELASEVRVPDVDEETFRAVAADAKDNCPVSVALAAVETVTLDATLV